jgi:2-dehydro-3-deoxyglucarate aldolase/4-hydroxy-2-oxoheptanedioate aldolase
MQRNHIKHTLKDGGWVLGTCLTDYLGTEAVTVLKAAGLDHFFVDAEHSRASFTDIQNLVRAAKGANLTPLVRIADIEYSLVARMLDCGAFGIIAPRIERPEQVENLVRIMKFPPRGHRGYGLRNIINDFEFTGAQSEMDSSDEETMVIPQVETKAAVECIDEIAAIPGVDATMVGPFDLSVSLGIPGQFDSAIFWDAFDRMVEGCNKYGVAPGVHAGNPEMLQKCKEHGARLQFCATDVSVMLKGMKSIRAAFPVEEKVSAGQGGYM